MADEQAAADPAPHKAGWRTTEFWLSTIALLVGALYATGIIAEETKWGKIVGVISMVLSGMGYSVSRGITKAAKLFLVAVTLPLILGACCRGHISADAVAPLIEDVSALHDKLVTKDPAISDADKATYLRSTELLRKVVKEAKGN